MVLNKKQRTNAWWYPCPCHLKVLLFVAWHAKVRADWWTNGDPSCPCLTSDFIKDLLRDASAGNGTEAALLTKAIPTYGIGCSAHDHGAYAGCDVTPKPKWCTARWCFVDPSACHLSIIPEWSVRFPGRRFSYETCGSKDTYKYHLHSSMLQGSTMKVVLMTNTGGWKGCFCQSDTACRGLLYSFFKDLLAHAGVVVDIVATFNASFPRIAPGILPDPVYHAFRQDQETSNSSFQACTYATGMGYVDLCIGAFSVTSSRRLISNMIPIFSEPWYILSKPKVKHKSMWASMFLCFEPLHWSCWLGILGCVILLSMMMSWHEGEYRNVSSISKLCSRITRAWIKGGTSLAGGGVIFDHQNDSKGVNITRLGFSFLILITVSNYTANLAAWLVVDKEGEPLMNSIDELVQSNTTICTLQFQKNIVKSLHPEMDSKGLIRTFDERSAILHALSSGDCTAGLLADDDLVKGRSMGRNCEIAASAEPLYFTSIGVPTSEKFYRSLAHYVTTEMVKGEFTKMRRGEMPKTKCEADIKDTHRQMKFESMLGPFILSLGIGAMGVVLHCANACRKRTRISGHDSVAEAASYNVHAFAGAISNSPKHIDQKEVLNLNGLKNSMSIGFGDEMTLVKSGMSVSSKEQMEMLTKIFHKVTSIEERLPDAKVDVDKLIIM